MKIPVPSPAMAVALLALVVASTGTAVAATTMINGSQIKPHSITSKQLKKGAVDSKALKKGAVDSKALGKSSVGPLNFQPVPIPGGIVTQTCPDGTKVVGAPCPIETFEPVSGSALLNEANIPAAANAVTFFQATAQGTASVTPRWAMAPNVPTRASKLTAEIVANPAVKWPGTVMVQLVVEGKATQLACTIVSPGPGGTNECAMPSSASMQITPRSRYTFAIFVAGVPGDPAWDAFTVGFGYISAICGKLETCG